MSEISWQRASATHASLRSEERDCLKKLRDLTGNDCEVGVRDALIRMGLIESRNGILLLTAEGRLIAEFC
jgi:hypothetical protein